MIYLDYQATTPVAPEVAAAMRPWIEEKFANPHSPSKWGREAAAAIEVARGQVERALGRADGSESSADAVPDGPLGKPLEEWRELLPADAYAVLFEEATEAPLALLE